MCSMLSGFGWWHSGTSGHRCHLRPCCLCSSNSAEVSWIQWCRAQPYGAFDSCYVSLNDLDVLCRVSDLVEHLSDGGLCEHLTNERKGGQDVWLDCTPWYLIGSAFIRSLELVTYFLEVCGMLVDVLGAVVYLWPSRCHYHEIMRFGRVNRDNGLR